MSMSLRYRIPVRGLALFLLVLFCGGLPFPVDGRQAELPPRVRVVLTRLSPMLEKHDYGKAIELIHRLQEETPVPEASAMVRSTSHHPEIYFVLGNSYLLQEQYADAIGAYRTALSGNPGHTYGWLNLAKAHYELQQYRDAGDCFARGYDAGDGENPETLYYSAAALLMGEQYQAAINTFARLQREHPGDFMPEWKEYYVHSLLSAEKSGEAVPIIIELIDCYEGEKRRQWQEILLNQYMQQRDPRRALAYATELTEESPQVATWWKARAHIELAASRYEKALGALVIYGFLTPLSGDERKLLADLYLQVGIPARAAPVYTEYLLASDDHETSYRLALAYDQLGQPERALDTLRAFEHRPQEKAHYDLYMLRGEISYRLQHYEEARSSFSKAAGCGKQRSGQAWLLAGYAALQLEEFGQSREAFNRAATYEPERAAATRALQQLGQIAALRTTTKPQERR